MSEPLRLSITDEKGLAEAADALHDGAFDPGAASYDPDTRTFNLVIWRETGSHQLLWVLPADVPDKWARCRLTLRQVEWAKIRVVRTEDQELRDWFFDMEYEAATRRIRFDVLFREIELRVTALDGELVDTGEVGSGWGAPPG